MIFGPVPLDQAEGAILAHSINVGDRRLRKGQVITVADLGALRAGGVGHVVVARPAADDLPEDAAAARLVEALAPDPTVWGLRQTEAFTGRVNLMAAQPGVFRVDAAAIARFNAVDPGVTIATLPDYTRVAEGMMVATIKIIPYAVPGAVVEAAVAAVAPGVLRVKAAVIRDADLVMTRTPGFADKLLKKGARVVTERLAALGVRVARVKTVAHETDAVAGAVAETTAPLVLILGASATSDAADVCPAGLVAAGGELTRFGMPVDPGNLLFLGEVQGRSVVGLPGCARSPALNGADWVLERLVCGIPVGDADIEAMGVGGLLKEIPIRPQPRVIRAPQAASPRIEVVLLAAGSGRRMAGTDKLLERVEGVPLLRRGAEAALASGAAAVHVVLPPDGAARAAVLSGLGVRHVTAQAAAEGMGASLRAGIAALSPQADAVIVALADMPDVTAGVYDALMAAFDPEAGAEICRAVSAGGQPGHPVLFGRRFLEPLSEVSGDVGARDVVRAGADYLRDVPVAGEAAVTDLDTPAQWAAYRARQA